MEEPRESFTWSGRASRISFKAEAPSEASEREANDRTPSDFGDEDRFAEKQPLVFSSPDMKAPRLTVWKKIAFGIGAMPYAMCNTVVGFYLSIFLLEVAILSPTYVLVIVFSGRVWDAITDPIVGFLCSRTRTRFGRLRPWMIVAAVPAGVVYLMLWFVPPTIDDRPVVVKFVYYLIFYFAFQALLTCIHVPYTALTMHLSHDNKERDSATLYRMCFEVAGTLLGILIYTVFYLGFVSTTDSEECVSGERVPEPLKRAAYRYHGLTVGVLIFLCILVTFLGIKEQKEEMRTDKRIGFFAGMREVLGFRPYMLLILIELFSWLAAQFVQGSAALYIKYTVGLESQYPYVIALLLVSTIAWMPVWQLVIIKFGKKTAFFAGIWLYMPLLIILLFVDFFPYAIYPAAAFSGLGVSSLYLLPWSMLPDVIDEAVLTSNVRREELFYAFFVFGNKFATGISLGFSTGIYKAAGYDETQCEQPWTVSLALKMLLVPPIFFLLVALALLHYYPITERSREKTKRLLQERRKSQSDRAGSPYLKRPRSISISTATPSQSPSPKRCTTVTTAEDSQTGF